jgi:hypothetical protein
MTLVADLARDGPQVKTQVDEPLRGRWGRNRRSSRANLCACPPHFVKSLWILQSTAGSSNRARVPGDARERADQRTPFGLGARAEVAKRCKRGASMAGGSTQVSKIRTSKGPRSAGVGTKSLLKRPLFTQGLLRGSLECNNGSEH